MTKPKIAVHQFSSCGGCQLALLDPGERLVELSQGFEIVHFAAAGFLDEDAEVDVALVEGSISTAPERERLQRVRAKCGFLVSLGACAASGGLQSLRNRFDGKAWAGELYERPDGIDLSAATAPIADQVKVDWTLWGCPVSGQQVWTLLRDLLSGVRPKNDTRPLCMECKQKQSVCTLVAKGEPCMGPVAQAGCGALCPAFGRACHACSGPAEQVNHLALARRFKTLGLSEAETARRFRFIQGNAKPYSLAADKLEGR
ncbi:MAG: sulfhydrogenase subunit delta [Gammaproteobacteria bacterium RIFOXYA12_FULL_61_12]|nr:MAG: sulfhydrogenase subunit delta [Gammaproteobacteria bacterium RIFOXYD12_FULL_61_37]OGT93261.1 MAG: sulfhydrogenase subunit delta [Gammaproteobacteria bacterium RIFOXYA12_FULL_61_12]